jgi:hypothetical protein
MVWAVLRWTSERRERERESIRLLCSAKSHLSPAPHDDIVALIASAPRQNDGPGEDCGLSDSSVTCLLSGQPVNLTDPGTEGVRCFECTVCCSPEAPAVAQQVTAAVK